MKRDKIELLAPAGSLPILKSAIDHGADAVYLGADLFNARINADNFTMDQIEEGCRYAHRRSSRVYLTLNTLIKENELDAAVELAVDAYNAGIDAILIQDIGLMSLLWRKHPEIPLHASTQMNVISCSDYKKLASCGVKRVVLPRELSLEEIRTRVRLASREGIGTEVFAHGAVCFCYSGLCLFSAMNKSGTRSGNRGLCAQPCRQEYILRNEGNDIRKGHVLSPKDRSVTEFIPDLIEAGVSSLKIEGRMRDINYVNASVSAYRTLIDAYYNGTYNKDTIKKVNDALTVNFNRGGGFTDQYLSGKKNEKAFTGEYVGKFGLRIGFISSTDAKKGNITVKTPEVVPVPSKGDFISIRQKNEEICSFPVGKIHEAPGSVTLKGLHPDMITKLPMKASVYLMNHEFKDIVPDKRKTPVNISLDIKDDLIKADIKVVSGMNSGSFYEEEFDLDTSFEGRALEEDRIISQMKKTGETPFLVNDVYLIGDKNVKCPVSFINDIRRSLTEGLMGEIDYDNSHMASISSDLPEDIKDHRKETGNITTMYYFPYVRGIKGDLRRDADIYAFSLYDLLDKKSFNRITDFVMDTGCRAVVVLPDACHDKISKHANNVLQSFKDEIGDLFEAVMDSDVNSSDSTSADLGVKRFAGFSANIMNSEALHKTSDCYDFVALSYELETSEVMEVLNESPVRAGLMVHSGGPIPWMQSDLCPVGRNKKDCRECFDKKEIVLSQGGEEKECRVITRPVDCSSSIWGPSKNNFSYSDIDLITDLGFDVIQCFTEV